MLARCNPPTCRLAQAVLMPLAALAALAVSAASAGAVTRSAHWQVRTLTSPTNISPANGGKLTVFASDVGGQATDGSTVTVTDTLPAGVTPTKAEGIEPTFTGTTMECSIAGQTVTCTYPEALPPLNETQLVLSIHVSVTPGTSGTLPNTATVSGGGAAEVTANEPITVSAQDPPFGLADFSTYDANAAGAQDTQAGDHPNALVTTFDINSFVSPDPAEFGTVAPVQDLKDVVVDLPLGLVGNPQSTPKCPQYDLTGQHGFRCPPDTYIGTVTVNTPGQEFPSSSPANNEPSPIVNVQPEAGYPAQFAFTLGSNAVMLYAKVVSTSSGYVVRVTTPGITRFIKAKGATLTFFGDPRGQQPFGNQPGTPAAFFTNPVDCTRPSFTTTIHVDSWQNPAPVPLNPDGSANFTAVNFNDPQWKNAAAVSPPVTGCDKLQFNPTLSLAPEADHSEADEPSGYEAVLRIPQNEDPNGLATPPLKNAVVTLPAGVSISPSAAEGLQGCTADQIGLDPATGIFSTVRGACPAGAQIGTATVITPLLSQPLEGRVYIAQPPCGGPRQPECTEVAAETGGVFGLYLEVEGSGVSIKLPGTVEVGGGGEYSRTHGLQSGQVRTTFANAPQQPFSELKLKFKGGARAPLANPQSCGSFTTTSALTPWSASSEMPAVPSPPFDISGCLNQFAPGFSAGTVNPQAGAFSPFTLTFSRHDREQDLAGITVHMPQGLVAKIAGIPRCGEADANAGTCSQTSRIGSATAAAGAGPHPFWQTGQVFLTGPYKGGPFGLSVVVPAKAGPYNLGSIVVRAAIYVDPHTAELTVVSDPLPQSIDGVPLRLQTVNVTVDREGFMLNPTSCAPAQVGAKLSGVGGAQAAVAARFQASGCAGLPFKPSFKVSTQARTSKANGASLDVKIAQASGEADIHKVDVSLPLVLPSRLTTLQKACSEAQFAANPAGCPTASDVGTATARTPLLNVPLTGPAYLVSHGGAAFPDLDILLQGEGITIDLIGNTDIKKGVTFSRFETVPDAPISSFELKLPEQSNSVLAAYGSLCSQKLVMPTTIVGQNGAQVTQSTNIAVTGCGKPSIKITKAKIKGNVVLVTVTTTQQGAVTVSGNGLKTIKKTLAAGAHQLKVSLTKNGRTARGHHHKKTKVKASVKNSNGSSSKTMTIKL
jgi:hypothetical protein